MKALNKMQRRAAVWILGAFKTSPLEGIEALAGLIPVKYHLQKIVKRSQLRPFKLPKSHILNNLIDDSPHLYNSFNMGSLTHRQKTLAKEHLIDLKIKSHGIFPSFLPLDPELTPGQRIIDNFSDHLSFNLVNKTEKGKTTDVPKNLMKWFYETRRF